MQELIKKQFDFKSSTEDMRKEPDPFRNLIDEFGEDGTGATTDTAIAATKYTVALGTTLLIDSIDIEADVETLVYMKKSVDEDVSIIRQYKLASKGNLDIKYPTPLSIVGTASGTATETFVQAHIKQPSIGRVSVGYNGRLIES